MDNYLFHVHNVEHRKALSKPRLSAHNFDIELGRRRNIRRHLRYCRACKSSCIGDEFHILMECTNIQLQELRNQCQRALECSLYQFKFLSIKDKFIYLISCADRTCCKIMASYISKFIVFLD